MSSVPSRRGARESNSHEPHTLLSYIIYHGSILCSNGHFVLYHMISYRIIIIIIIMSCKKTFFTPYTSHLGSPPAPPPPPPLMVTPRPLSLLHLLCHWRPHQRASTFSSFLFNKQTIDLTCNNGALSKGERGGLFAPQYICDACGQMPNLILNREICGMPLLNTTFLIFSS